MLVVGGGLMTVVKSFAYVEFYVANLPVIHFLFRSGLGFTDDQSLNFIKDSDKTSYVISQNHIKIILSSSPDSLSELSKEVSISGDFIKDIAFEVENIEKIIKNANVFGARVLEPIQEITDGSGTIKKASIGSFGCTKHSLIQKNHPSGSADHLQRKLYNNKNSLEDIDHIAVAVEYKNLQKWAKFYEDVFGLNKIFEENVSTEYSGMNSVVLGNDLKRIRIVLVSPMDGKGKSQISDFISNNNGEGIQHVAFSTSNIIETIKSIKNNGLEFLDIDDAYYNKLVVPHRYKNSYIADLKHLKILFDQDEYGELLQIFSKTLHTKQTWFFEVIERNGARTFGRGNIKKLYEAIENEFNKQYAK
jgi:4-hydroxyphenylpyruvate dioxygenase